MVNSFLRRDILLNTKDYIPLPEMHTKARTPLYAGRKQRTSVPDELVDWKVEWRGYRPVEYTDRVVLERPVWADPDIRFGLSICRTLWIVQNVFMLCINIFRQLLYT